MLKNYLKIAVRNLLKYKFYSLINIFGLGIGIAAFLFILLFIQDELSYDQYHQRADQIYRVDMAAKLGPNEIFGNEVAAATGPVVTQEYPEVDAFFRFRTAGSYIINYENDSYKEENLVYADSTFFDFFSIPLLQGDPKTALTVPNSIVISEAMAKKYFGIKEAMGKSLNLDGDNPYKVTGIMAETPKHTHFNFDFLLAMSGFENSRDNNWGSFNFITYLLLKDGTNVPQLRDKIQATFKKNFSAAIEEFLGSTWDQFMTGGNYAQIELMPLKDIHLHSNKSGDLLANGDIRYVYIFGFIALFILLIAGINFVNLSTARSVNRAKEVGVRKVVGALRNHLIPQFLSESVLIAFVALLLSLGLNYLLLPYFNGLTQKSFSLADIFTPNFLLVSIGLTLTIGLLSGLYPAMYLSNFQPIKVLKGSLISNKNNGLFRNTLVVFQFFVTTILIIGTIVIFQQLQFMQNKKLGFNKEQVLVLDDVYTLENNLNAFKNRVDNNPAVTSSSVSNFLPVPSNRNFSSFFKGKTPSVENSILIANWIVDFDYVETMGLEIINGRNFDKQLQTDSTAILINEELAAQLGYENPIGEFMSGLNFNENGEEDGATVYPIIGVYKNFHYASLRENIKAQALFIGSSRGALSIRLKNKDMTSFISQLEADWKEMAPNQPFSYQFLDSRFNRMFEAEQQLGKIASTFSFIAIFIACIGLLGLATFIAQQRTKEIGIRKVLGAQIPNLVYLLCKDFGKLILIAFLLASPISWYFMNKWLEDFAYATTIGVGGFLLAALLISLMAALSIIYQATRVALINPVDTLKSE